MLYDSDYDHLFEGEVNSEPIEKEETEVEDQKTFGEWFKEFVEEHPFVWLAGCAVTGLLAAKIYRKIYNRGWNACAKYFQTCEDIVRRNLLTKNLES